VERFLAARLAGGKQVGTDEMRKEAGGGAAGIGSKRKSSSKQQNAHTLAGSLAGLVKS
jgi:hypothetical protein